MEYYLSEDPFLRLYMLYRRTGAAMHRVRRKELRKYGLSEPETAVLHVVHASKNTLTPAMIAKQLVQDNHATSQLLIRMEKRELVKKVKDLPRPNMVRIVLTDYGEKMFKKSQNIKSIRSMLSVLPGEESRQMTSSLYKIWEKALETK